MSLLRVDIIPTPPWEAVVSRAYYCSTCGRQSTGSWSDVDDFKCDQCRAEEWEKILISMEEWESKEEK